MEFRNLGGSGLEVSLVGVGCNNMGGRIDQAAADNVVAAALEHGVTLFDTADVYNRGASEIALGKALGARRTDIVLATKFGLRSMTMDDEGRLKGGSRRYMMRAVEDSLKRLGTDWIDLYQLHQADPDTPIEETLRGVEDLIRAGKVRYFGVSNFAAWQVVEAQLTAANINVSPIVSTQSEYSLLWRGPETELVPALEQMDVSLLPYFPLASGVLSGRYKRGEQAPEGSRGQKAPGLVNRYLTDENYDRIDRLQAFCKARDKSLLELAFSWLAAQPVVASVIAGASTGEQVAQNVGAVEWYLSEEEIEEVDRILAD